MALSNASVLHHASHIRPCPGERVSGDTAVLAPLDEGLFAGIVDVLGHGPEAHDLALKIDAYLARYRSADVAPLLIRLHGYLKGTRGAAVGLCAFDAAAGRLEFVGAGNTLLRRFGRGERQGDTRLVSQPGVLGQNMRTPQCQTLQLEPGDVVLLHTDGISERFSLSDCPGLLEQTPEEIAARIIDRFGKGHDDAGCIAVRYQA
jgi:serine phosphatase RsbU (regulator of sigma subunit)